MKSKTKHRYYLILSGLIDYNIRHTKYVGCSAYTLEDLNWFNKRDVSLVYFDCYEL